MATDLNKQLEVDHLSALPDDLLISILSLLPSNIAACTSVLSRRFRHLWKASPYLDLSTRPLIKGLNIKFVDIVNCALFRRNPSHTILSLHLDLYAYVEFKRNDSLLASLLVKAQSYGVRHLTIGNFSVVNMEHIFFVIFSIDTLTSLSLDCLPCPQTIQQFDLFSSINLTHLRTLCLRLNQTDDLSILNQLVSSLSSLQDLQLTLTCMHGVSLIMSSHTIKNLKLTFCNRCPQLVTLSFSYLELLQWNNHGKYVYFHHHFHGETPLLRKAVISLNKLYGDKLGLARLLAYISHVEDLILHVKESQDEMFPIPLHLKKEKNPVPTLSEAAKVAPNFSNLKSLDATLCCHEHNIRAIVTILAKSPALESLKFVHDHEVSKLSGSGKKKSRKKSNWESKLLHTNGIWHQNLHLDEKKKELINYLMRCVNSGI